ncbi:MAG: lysoplasmalogenase [Proteobacteria bacterium]|nr:lysoplasmalogenase [Pseudomonadota bacterium]
MPTPRQRWFAIAVALAGAGLIAAEVSGVRAAVYVLKPLATILVLAMALTSPARPSNRYRLLIAGGLVWSLAGDVLLMWPTTLFAAGLGCFLVAHFFYIGAFATHGAGRAAGVRSLLPFALIAGVMLALLWPGLGALRVPVAVYVGVIATMAWQAWARALAVRSAPAWRGAIGALFFLSSDGALAVNKFRAPIGDAFTATLVILGTYLVAQWMIASTVGDGE